MLWEHEPQAISAHNKLFSQDCFLMNDSIGRGSYFSDQVVQMSSRSIIRKAVLVFVSSAESNKCVKIEYFKMVYNKDGSIS